ncbi:MAG: glycosyltransferase family 4 protein, partial [Pyrinomonadaceae bacterium]
NVVRSFLDLPNTSLEVVGDVSRLNVATARTLARVFRNYKPEIVHLHYTGFLGIYPWLARLLSARKVFFTDHSSRPAGYVSHRAPFWKKGLARIINWPLTKVVCVSGYGYRCMTSLSLLPPDRFELIYNAVDLSRVSQYHQRGTEFRHKYSIPLDRALVIQVSWIIPEKGILDLLEAARLVVAQRPNVHFVFVGEGAYREQYMKATEAMQLQENVTWTGLVADPFGEGVFEAADIICQVSRWEEVFGWMIVEGMAHGKAIVATRVGGIPELVMDNDSGFLVERGDSVAMAEKILWLLERPELRSDMGTRGREMVTEKFQLKSNVSQLLELYGLGLSLRHKQPS